MVIIIFINGLVDVFSGGCLESSTGVLLLVVSVIL